MKTKKIILPLATFAFAACSSNRPDSFPLTDWVFTLDGDTASRHVQVPHDWSIPGPFDMKNPTGNAGGYLPSGKGIYSTVVKAPEGLKGSDRIRLYFDGVFQNSKVSVNGHEAGGHHYGYFPFWVDVTDIFNRKGDNSVKVEVDNSAQPNCRWYSGSGIYRDVDLAIAPETEILPWSLQILTPDADAANAVVALKADLFNHSTGKTESRLTARIYDDKSKRVASKTIKAVVPAGSPTRIETEITVCNPRLWDIDTPHIYTLEITDKAGRVLASSTFGIRSAGFTPEEGFKINGRTVKLNGACVHHDNGVLGARSFPAAEWMKAKWIKDAGFNAVRTSHNPPSRHFLDACDRLGLVVIDEAFDGWRQAKNPGDYSNWFADFAEDDIQRMVLRDRNHPSVIAWSIGNEILERKTPRAVEDAHNLVTAIRKFDVSRPTTHALCAWDADWEIYDPLAAESQVVGYNYMIHKHESDHERVPSRIMWQTESYPRDAFENWKRTAENPYIAGDFVWTGLDYLGESGIGRNYYEGQTPGESWQNDLFPWHGAYCGDIDINGHLKPIGHYRRILWNEADTTSLYIGVREPQGYHGQIHETMWSAYPTRHSWTWPGHEGKPIDVEIYSRAKEVTLCLNGSVVGTASPSVDNGYTARFTIPYTPGHLRAFSSSGAEQTLDTAGKTSSLEVVKYAAPEHAELDYYLVQALDADGLPVPEAMDRISVSINGEAAEILAVANADLADSEPYFTPVCSLWHGRALVVVKPGNRPYSLNVRMIQ